MTAAIDKDPAMWPRVDLTVIDGCLETAHVHQDRTGDLPPSPVHIRPLRGAVGHLAYQMSVPGYSITVRIVATDTIYTRKGTA